MVVEIDIKKLNDVGFKINNTITLDKKLNKKQLIENLESIVNLFENDLTKWLNRFGWQKDSLLLMKNKNNSDQVYLTCPFNSGHTKILEKNYDKHVSKCRLGCSGYTTQDIVSYFISKIFSLRFNLQKKNVFMKA
jgi:hypothetical protein